MNADILIVDDSGILRKVMRKAIGQLGVPPERIREAADGRQALDALAEAPADLILLDLHMPEMDGQEFATHKAADPELSKIPFVVVSTEANAQRLMEMVELGALGVLRKPFEPEDLRRMVQDYLSDEVMGQAAEPEPEALRGEDLDGLSRSDLEGLLTRTLERTAFLLTEPEEVELTEGEAHHAHITYTGSAEEADVFLSASSGFLRELAASLLGMEEDDPSLDDELVEALSELANIVAGEIVVALGGEQERFALGIPGACDQPGGSAEDASVACGVGSFGEGLQVSVFRRRSA